MKVIKPKITYIFDCKFYLLSEDKEIRVGTILYDGRKEEFIKIETEEDLMDYHCVAPECYAILKEMKV